MDPPSIGLVLPKLRAFLVAAFCVGPRTPGVAGAFGAMFEAAQGTQQGAPHRGPFHLDGTTLEALARLAHDSKRGVSCAPHVPLSPPFSITPVSRTPRYA